MRIVEDPHAHSVWTSSFFSYFRNACCNKQHVISPFDSFNHNNAGISSREQFNYFLDEYIQTIKKTIKFVYDQFIDPLN